MLLYSQTADLLVSGLVAAVFAALALYALWQPKPPGPGATWYYTYTGRGYYYRGGTASSGGGGGSSGGDGGGGFSGGGGSFGGGGASGSW